MEKAVKVTRNNEAKQAKEKKVDSFPGSDVRKGFHQQKHQEWNFKLCAVTNYNCHYFLLLTPDCLQALLWYNDQKEIQFIGSIKVDSAEVWMPPRCVEGIGNFYKTTQIKLEVTSETWTFWK